MLFFFFDDFVLPSKVIVPNATGSDDSLVSPSFVAFFLIRILYATVRQLCLEVYLLRWISNWWIRFRHRRIIKIHKDLLDGRYPQGERGDENEAKYLKAAEKWLKHGLQEPACTRHQTQLDVIEIEREEVREESRGQSNRSKIC
jgi:hypothetical protein